MHIYGQKVHTVTNTVQQQSTIVRRKESNGVDFRGKNNKKKNNINHSDLGQALITGFEN